MTKRRAVVIGGGHNGLICGAYLAKAGFKVTVFEARDAVGGAIARREFADGFFAPGLAHTTHVFQGVVDDLAIVTTASAEAAETIALDREGAHLTLTDNDVEGAGLPEADRTAYRDFVSEYASYADALTPLLTNAPPRLKNFDRRDGVTLAKIGWKLRFGLGGDPMREFLRVGGMNIYDILNEKFADERLKAAIALDAVMGHHMAPRTPATVLTYLQRRFARQKGVAVSVAALQDAAVRVGVEIRTNAKIDRVIVEDGKARGVVLASGETCDADIVASNADAKSTFLRLVGARALDGLFVHRISKTRTNGDVAKIHLALSAAPPFNGLSPDRLNARMVIAPTQQYVEHAFNASKYGAFTERPVLEIMTPSAIDTGYAPSGAHVLSVNAAYAPCALKGGWENDREAFLEAVLNVLDEYAPGLKRLVQSHEILTPVDIEAEYHMSGGHWHHGEMAIDQSFMMRPVHGAAQYQTPIEGLYLCGAAAHPGGDVTGLPGRNAAKRVIDTH